MNVVLFDSKPTEYFFLNHCTAFDVRGIFLKEGGENKLDFWEKKKRKCRYVCMASACKFSVGVMWPLDVMWHQPTLLMGFDLPRSLLTKVLGMY